MPHTRLRFVVVSSVDDIVIMLCVRDNSLGKVSNIAIR